MLRARWAALVAVLAAALWAAPAEAQVVHGEQRVLVVLSTWGPQPFGVDEVHTAIRQADAFVRRSSFGRARLHGTVTRWLNVLTPPAGCPADWWGAVPRSVTGPASAAAFSAGYDAMGYDRIVYVVPESRCNFRGFGLEPEVVIVGSTSWSLLVHELGHTWGLAHARSTQTTPTGFHTYHEYGDLYSLMGDGSTDFSVYEKFVLGWRTDVERVTRSGTFTIERAGLRGRLPVALRIETTLGEFWFEYRAQPLVRLDGTVPGGVLVRFVDPTDAFVPLAASSVLILDPVGRGRPTLAAGDRFRVPGVLTVQVTKRQRGSVALRVSLLGR